MTTFLYNFNRSIFALFYFSLSSITIHASADNVDEESTLKALENAKQAFTKKDYNRMWQEMDTITQWLEVNSPRTGLSWDHAEQMIKDWIKKNWYEDVLMVKPLSEGAMENTTQHHMGSFYGWTWDTGEKTVSTDFVFEAAVKARNSKGKELDHKIRFHFDKNQTGWYIQRAGVM
jgi:hypothetical protein